MYLFISCLTQCCSVIVETAHNLDLREESTILKLMGCVKSDCTKEKIVEMLVGSMVDPKDSSSGKTDGLAFVRALASDKHKMRALGIIRDADKLESNHKTVVEVCKNIHESSYKLEALDMLCGGVGIPWYEWEKDGVELALLDQFPVDQDRRYPRLLAFQIIAKHRKRVNRGFQHAYQTEIKAKFSSISGEMVIVFCV